MLLTRVKPCSVPCAVPILCSVVALLFASACTDPTIPFSSTPLAPPASGPDKAGPGGSAQLEKLAAAHRANPSDPAAALAYARALRRGDAKPQALAVLDAAAASKASNRQLTLERGLLALDLGHAAKAETLLRAAHDPKSPDWRLHSALGAALAARGRQPEAQAQFAKALALAPNHPTVLNNLAISYALDGKAGEAEKVLRTAATAKTSPEAGRVRQNLALVLGLSGKYDESRTIGESALPADRVKGNVAYLQKLAEARTAGQTTSSSPAGKEVPRKSASAPVPPPTYQLGARTDSGK